MVVCYSESLQQKLIDVGGNKYSFNTHLLWSYYVLGTREAMTGKTGNGDKTGKTGNILTGEIIDHCCSP